MTSLGAAFAWAFSGQLVARSASFLINMYFLRVVDLSLLGYLNVRATLLYQTVLFLTREPFRKATLNSEADVATQSYVNFLWLSPLVCILNSLVCWTIWAGLADAPPAGSEWTPVLAPALLLSALIEGAAEPLAAFSLRVGAVKRFALAQSTLVFAQRAVPFLLIVLGRFDHSLAFVIGNLVASTVYALLHFSSLLSGARPIELKGRWLLPSPSSGLPSGTLSGLGALFGHSVVKQLLTDGTGYVMTFTTLLTLPQQAAYDTIERLGSLVARIAFAPLEETAFAHFARNLGPERVNEETERSVLSTFQRTMRTVTVLGSVVAAFGVPYSRLAVSIYGGQFLLDNGGTILLALYAFYILFLAANGVTEALAFATMNGGQVLRHGRYLIIFSLLHLALSVGLCRLVGPAGFIGANMLNMALRVAYAWRHISTRFGPRLTPSLAELLPGTAFLAQLVLSATAAGLAGLIFGGTPGIIHTTAHVAVGALLLVMLLGQLVHVDPLFHEYWAKILAWGGAEERARRQE